MCPSGVQSIEVLEPSAACCPSVLAAPLDAEDAAELAKGFGALATRPGSGSFRSLPTPTRARCVSAISSSPSARVSRPCATT